MKITLFGTGIYDSGASGANLPDDSTRPCGLQFRRNYLYAQAYSFTERNIYNTPFAVTIG